MEGLTIRECTAADIEGIQKVNALTWNNSYRSIFERNILKNINLKGRSEWHEDLPKSSKTKTIVGIIDDEVVGYCTMGPLRDSTTMHWISNSTFDQPVDGWGEIYSIYVLKPHSRLGIGKALFELAKNILKNLGYDKFQSFVLANNVPTIKFYQSLGCIAKITRDWSYMDTTYKEVGLVFYLGK